MIFPSQGKALRQQNPTKVVRECPPRPEFVHMRRVIPLFYFTVFWHVPCSLIIMSIVTGPYGRAVKLLLRKEKHMKKNTLRHALLALSVTACLVPSYAQSQSIGGTSSNAVGNSSPSTSSSSTSSTSKGDPHSSSSTADSSMRTTSPSMGSSTDSGM